MRGVLREIPVPEPGGSPTEGQSREFSELAAGISPAAPGRHPHHGYGFPMRGIDAGSRFYRDSRYHGLCALRRLTSVNAGGSPPSGRTTACRCTTHFLPTPIKGSPRACDRAYRRFNARGVHLHPASETRPSAGEPVIPGLPSSSRYPGTPSEVKLPSNRNGRILSPRTSSSRVRGRGGI